MKRSLLRTLAVAAVGLMISVAFSACQSFSAVQPEFNVTCNAITADFKTLSTSPLFNAADQATFAKAATANGNICSASGQLNVANLQDLQNTILPSVTALIQGNPLIPDQTAILLALNTFGPMIQGLVDQAIATAAAAKSASSPTPASAPAAASQ
jgi:hypothetical protein